MVWLWACLRKIPPFTTALSAPEPTNDAPLSLVSIHGAILGGCTNYMKWSSVVLVTAFTAHCFFVIIKMILTKVAVAIQYCTFTYDVLTFKHTSCHYTQLAGDRSILGDVAGFVDTHASRRNWF